MLKYRDGAVFHMFFPYLRSTNSYGADSDRKTAPLHDRKRASGRRSSCLHMAQGFQTPSLVSDVKHGTTQERIDLNLEMLW